MSLFKSKTPTIKFGKIELPIKDGTSPYVPKSASVFIDHGDILKTIAIGIRDNMAVLLVGESGTGKTSAIRYVASETKAGLRRVNLNGGTTADELVGRMLINDQGTYWVDGILTEAMRNGDLLVLDEINAALPEVLFVLQSVMDDDGYLVLNEKPDKEVIYKHPDFRIFATCNPPEYAGTKEMNKALLSRFGICINAEFPKPEKELEIIEHHLGKAIAETAMATQLVGLANETRIAKENGNQDYAINTRDILNTLRLLEFMEPQEAFALAFANKLDNSDNKVVRALARLHLPTTKKAANRSRTPITSNEDINIGNTYIMNADIHNAYYSLTSDDQAFETVKNMSAKDIILNASRDSGVKNDEFIVEGTYYEGAVGLSRAANDTSGAKIGCAIKILDGPNKGKKAILLHHPKLDKTGDIVKNISELN